MICKTNNWRTFLSRSKSERKREKRDAFRSHIHRVSSSIDRHWLACLPVQSAKRRTSKNWLVCNLNLWPPKLFAAMVNSPFPTPSRRAEFIVLLSSRNSSFPFSRYAFRDNGCAIIDINRAAVNALFLCHRWLKPRVTPQSFNKIHKYILFYWNIIVVKQNRNVFLSISCGICIYFLHYIHRTIFILCRIKFFFKSLIFFLIQNSNLLFW